MKKHFLIFLILIIGCSNSGEEAETVQDTTTTTVQDTTTTVQDTPTTVQDTTSEVDDCSKKTSPDKCHYVAVSYDKPQNEFAQEIVVATDVPQTIVDEYYEIQNMLNSIIGSYNRYVTVITTTNEFSQPIFDKLTEIHWEQELNIVDGYL